MIDLRTISCEGMHPSDITGEIISRVTEQRVPLHAMAQVTLDGLSREHGKGLDMRDLSCVREGLLDLKIRVLAGEQGQTVPLQQDMRAIDYLQEFSSFVSKQQTQPATEGVCRAMRSRGPENRHGRTPGGRRMIIDRIILKNFKRFRLQEIRFRDGITGILGNNGTGKSSIVEAIIFALYGVQSTGIAADYIVSSFASPKEKCEVRLDFRVGGDDYTVLRTFKKGKTVQHDATFHKGGKLLATGVSQVEAEVRRTLGMGPVDFRNTVYAAQKDLLTLLENTPGKRKEWFLRALGIDYLKTESDRLLKERTDAKDRELHLLEGELKGLVGRQDPEELKNLQDSVATCKARNQRP